MTNEDHRSRIDLAPLLCVALAMLLVHLFVNGRYGFHRDELATLDDARHLAWGYVAYPPVTPFFARLSLEFFGTSLTGFRFFAALMCAIATLLAGFIAADVGGRRGAQLLAACAAASFGLAAGSLMQYVAFDYLCWVACAWSFTRLCASRNPRWWLAVGACIGLGMLTKYSMLVCVAGVAVGVLLTNLRAHLTSKWLWLGAALSLLIFLPNFIWQVQHDFVSLDFLRHIHERDVRIGRTKDFLPDQLQLTLFALPLAVVGLWFYFLSANGRPFRALGWLYIVPFFFFLSAKGRGYYLAPAYPVLYAGGAVWLEELFASLRLPWALAFRAVMWCAIAASIVITAAFTLPVAPIQSRWWKSALQTNGDFAEEFGWMELVETVAQVRNSVPPNEQKHLAILTGNYGEAGAIDLYGRRYDLPQAISGVNSYWARGYGAPPPQTLIVLGFSRKFLERHFESCELAGHLRNRYDVANEETTDHPDVFVCRRLRGGWREFWELLRSYG